MREKGTIQEVDCNCNDCLFMERDLFKYKYWESFQRQMQLDAFIRAKNDAQLLAYTLRDKELIRKAEKMKFQFDKSYFLNYGKCLKFNKAVSFLPNTCQLHTRDCFEYRKSGAVLSVEVSATYQCDSVGD